MWRTIRDVLIAAMNKGLFVPACVFFLLLIMLLKTPSSYFPTLWKALGDYKEWGYIVAVSVVCGWIMNVRYLRRVHHAEMARVTAEKKQLQEELAGHSLPSSAP
jgi:hypothetical protein